MKVLGIIPARGGSKGITNKNMQLLNGKPLVLHATDTAIKSKALDRIILSSDDDEIIKAVRTRPEINIPFKRPAELATDTAKISDTIAHLLNWLEDNENYIPDAFMLLEPTSPLRTIYDIYESLKLFEAEGKPSLIAVSQPHQHPSNMIFKNNKEFKYCMDRKQEATGRQDFHQTWFINGAIYLTQTKYFKKTNKVFDLNNCILYEIPSERAFDINTHFDLELLRAHIQNTKQEEEVYA